MIENMYGVEVWFRPATYSHMTDWLDDNIGEEKYTTRFNHHMNKPDNYYFEDEIDAMAFKLRWL